MDKKSYAIVLLTRAKEMFTYFYRKKKRQKYLLRKLLFAVLSAYLATHRSSAVELMVFISLGFRLLLLSPSKAFA